MSVARCQYSNGDRYVGSWADGVQAGKGNYYAKSGVELHISTPGVFADYCPTRA